MGKPGNLIDDFTQLVQATWLDLPMALGQRLFNGAAAGEAREGQVQADPVQAAGWRAYDAWVRLANEASNQLYANRAFGELTARSFTAALRLQRASDAVVSAVAGNVLPALGLPSPTEVQASRQEARALRQDAEALQQEAEALRQDAEALRNDVNALRAELQAVADLPAVSAPREMLKAPAKPAADLPANIIWNAYRPAKTAKRSSKRVAL